MPDAEAEPLGARFEPARTHGGAKLCAVSYASGGERVSGWWVVPEGPGPHAGLVFQHWGALPAGDRLRYGLVKPLLALARRFAPAR